MKNQGFIGRGREVMGKRSKGVEKRSMETVQWEGGREKGDGERKRRGGEGSRANDKINCRSIDF